MTLLIPAPCQCDRLVEKGTLSLVVLNVFIEKVRISDLSSVDINWRMLTLARPESKIEEEIFSKWEFLMTIQGKPPDYELRRLVHLDKLRLATRREESEILFDAGGKDPDIIVKAASESKGGVIEKLIKVDGH